MNNRLMSTKLASSETAREDSPGTLSQRGTASPWRSAEAYGRRDVARLEARAPEDLLGYFEDI